MDFTINMMESGRGIASSQAAALSAMGGSLAAYQAQQAAHTTAHLIPINAGGGQQQHVAVNSQDHGHHGHLQQQQQQQMHAAAMHDDTNGGMIETKTEIMAKDEIVTTFTPPSRVASVGSVTSHPGESRGGGVVEKCTNTNDFEPAIKVEIRGQVPGFGGGGNDKDKTDVCQLHFNNPNELIHYFSQRALPQLDAFNLLTNPDLVRNINPDLVRNHFLYVQNGQEGVRVAAPNGFQTATAAANQLQVSQTAQAAASAVSQIVIGGGAGAGQQLGQVAKIRPVKTERRRGEVPPGTIINKTPPVENNPNQFMCWVCGMNLQKSLPFEEHMVEMHSIEKPYRCEDCGVSFKQKAHIDRHKRIHLPTRPYQCGVCGKGFTRNEHVRRHSFTHSGEKPYQCPSPTCTKMFSRQQQLTKHLLTHTKQPRSDSPQHPGHSTGLPTTLLLQTTDQNGRIITINQGGQGLPLGQALSSGQAGAILTQGGAVITPGGGGGTRGRAANGEPVSRPYQCGVCGKAFIRNEHLRRHMLIHSGEKPHVCGTCCKAFPRREHLTKHMRSHKDGHGQQQPLSASSTNASAVLPVSVTIGQHTSGHHPSVATGGIPAGVSVVTSGHQPMAAHSGALNHTTVHAAHPGALPPGTHSLPPGTHYLPMFGLLAEVV